MPQALPRQLIALRYEEYAQEYLRSLPLEHFMEASAQAMQRAITLACLGLLRLRRRDFHLFNEMLVQWPRPRRRRPGQVVPDNMVVLTLQEITADGSYNLPLEPCGPFWVLEYVSKSNKRKDYEVSFRKYERELKVPYCLLFYPDTQDLTLFHLRGKRYVAVLPNENDRYAIPELEIEIGLLEGWVRYWYQGKLLPLPEELDQQNAELKRQATSAEQRASDLEQRLADREAELGRLRQELEQRNRPSRPRKDGK